MAGLYYEDGAVVLEDDKVPEPFIHLARQMRKVPAADISIDVASLCLSGAGLLTDVVEPAASFLWSLGVLIYGLVAGCTIRIKVCVSARGTGSLTGSGIPAVI